MKNKVILCIALHLIMSGAGAQLQSPHDFLAYQVGTRFTPHHRIVDYFSHVATLSPGTVKLKSYGTTVEGRPLLLAIVSSPENISRLEQIRLNNLRIANLAADRAAPVLENAPAIVWLSYNVHGNEASSSEAAMLTLHSFASAADPKIRSWLNNTVVIIDPCINPDGRDRYANWYNSVTGMVPDPKLSAREHREPWPGGRTNHYYFDLNRDWAWQTQQESQQRIVAYNEWMPHVHVDYHEQGVNAPYYFAPAAEPFHEVITPWQRQFQTTIGRNNAKYFDANGWLYFTREIFDLYYPSYGDTWPTYSGAVGMTYEQAGGPAGGLAALTGEGDTLTLLDRVTHHYTTSLSTVEITSQHAAQVVGEFRKFFNQAVSTGVGEYKSYIIRQRAEDGEKIRSMLQLLTRNGIRYGYAAKGAARAYNYQLGREESITLQDDIVISALQPRSALVKVLFEPRPQLPDSLTYDITAWSLPFAYGLQAYASKEKIQAGGKVWAAVVPEIPKGAYGYVIRWQGVQSAKAVTQLLEKGIRLRFTETPFSIDGKQFGRGSVIVLANGNEARPWFEALVDAAHSTGIRPEPVSTGFVEKGFDFGSSKVHVLKAPRVALLTGETVSPNASGEVWHFMERELGYPVTLIQFSPATVVDWNDWDVVIMPSGGYRFLNEKASFDVFRDWISKGGRVIAMESAAAALSRTDLGIKTKKKEEEEEDAGRSADAYGALRRFENRERDDIARGTPGAVLKVELDNTHPLAYGYPEHYYTLKMDGTIYEFIKEGGWNVGVIKKDSPVAGFVGAELKKQLQDGLLFGVKQVGRGTVTLLADNVLFRNFWENGKLIFCNALFLVGQ